MQKIPVAIIALITILQTTVRADYAMPPIEDIIKSQQTTIVDATVTDITKNGHAIITTHEILKGESTPRLLKGLHLSCTCPTPSEAGVIKGKRYIFVLQGSDIYEGSTYWEVLKGFDGELKCHFTGNWQHPSRKPKPGGIFPNGLYKLDNIKKELLRVANSPG